MAILVKVIRQLGQLSDAIQEMSRSKAIAVDIEANSRYRYPEQLCLIQLATDNRIFIIDTIILKETQPLEDIFHNASIIKVFHSADYDIRSLNRHCGFQIRGIFDTAIAAQFVGIKQFGLTNLLNDLLGIAFEKIIRLQKSDWGKRPLSLEALEYAADDVRYLLKLRRFLYFKLRELGRNYWVTEECSRLEKLRYEPKDPNTTYLSVKGAGKLDGTNLSILKALFQFREKEALRYHRPPYYIIPDPTLVHLAENPKADLSTITGLGQIKINKYCMGIQRAIAKGLASPPIFREKPENMSAKEEERLKRLKAWRASIATSHSLNPSLIWPTNSLERLATDMHTLDKEYKSGDIRDWQRLHFASSLSVLLASL